MAPSDALTREQARLRQRLDAIGARIVDAAFARGAALRRVLATWPDASRILFEEGLSRTEVRQCIAMAPVSANLRSELDRWLGATGSRESVVVAMELVAGLAPLPFLARLPLGTGPITGLEPASAIAPDFTIPASKHASHQLVLIAKLTRHCNLRCTYCVDWREGPGQQMPASVQAAMLRRAFADPRYSAVKIVWHGGEPALLGVRRALRFLWLQARLGGASKVITNSVQTNGAALPQPMIDLWHAFDMRVSVSLDGPRAAHDRTRPTRRGEASFDAVKDGIARLRDAGIFSGALVVATPDIMTLDTRELVEGLIAAGVTRAAFLPVRPEAKTGTGPYVAPESFAQFLTRVFDLLRLNRHLDFDVREIDALYLAYKGRPTGFCELNGPCLGDYFAIEPDGRALHCDKFLGNEDYALGSVQDMTFAEMCASENMTRLHLRDDARRDRLARCRWYGRCRGWCPHESHIAEMRGTAGDCCGLAPVFEHFENLEASAREHV